METLGLKCWHGAARQMPRAHTHLELEANLVISGGLGYLLGGSLVEVQAGELALFWGSVPHQLISLVPDSEILWLALPLSQFLGWKLPLELTQTILQGQIAKQRAELPRDAALFRAWEADLASENTARIEIAQLEIQARLWRLALGLDAPAPVSRIQSASTSKEISHVEKMAAFMTQNYVVPLKTEEIARAAGVHPNYAMNLFKREFGISLGEFLTRTRLAEAQRLLVTSDKKVLDIAFSCGFGSASRFHAAFKAQCGQSPADYRRALRS